jgi:hypothetical protein
MTTYTPSLFSGDTFDEDRDGERLRRLFFRVQLYMDDGQWHTLRELAVATGGSEASVSARLRDLRKPKFGSQTVERRYIAHGLWEYRLVLPAPTTTAWPELEGQES